MQVAKRTSRSNSLFRWNKSILGSLVFLISAFAANAQNCDVIVKGVINDEHSEDPIQFVNVYLEESRQGAVSDERGNFELTGICPGQYHIVVSHIGCETKRIFLNISSDTSIDFILDHGSHLLHEIAIRGHHSEEGSQESHTLDAESINENSEDNLAGILDGIAGVDQIKTGNTISKPVVHGLSGNRLLVLNNGVSQAGQQWGADHAPAIDPLQAGRITVVKGVSAVEYQGASLGGVVLIQPSAIDRDPHLHSDLSYFYQTNGRGHGFHTSTSRYNKILSWKLNTTIKKSGDLKTPNYFLTNTGKEEANASLQLERNFGERVKADVFVSSFNTRLGILRGSHIGNLNDLQEALIREEPFYTNDSFSYLIQPPSQEVNHHLGKVHVKYILNDSTWFDVNAAVQQNLRKEFDVRRSGRSYTPALSLDMRSAFLEGKFQTQIRQKWLLKSGAQYMRKDNVNAANTGILPLIPDYISDLVGAFTVATYKTDSFAFELGARYDLEDRRVVTISQDLPRRPVRFNDSYHNLNIGAGIHMDLNNSIGWSYNLGFANRNPEVNELYSNGLHQGVSGYEIGDPNLESERSFKQTFNVLVNLNDRLIIEGLGYLQFINDYIYLNPENASILTIRGAFPVFRYRQTDARIYGFDLVATHDLNRYSRLLLKYAHIKGTDLERNVGLVNLPSNKITGRLSFHVPTFFGLENIEFHVSDKFVFQQSNIQPWQDFLAVPDAYNLINAELVMEKQWKKRRVKFWVRSNNLANTRYREYLNRLRYFADETGIDVVIGAKLSL